jgi:apolipoprotein N-acyltransferase
MHLRDWSLAPQLALVFAGGAASVLAFAPFSLALLLPPLLALLFVTWRYAASAGRAAALGYAFGLGLMGFGVFWLRISIAQFGGVPAPMAVVITLGFIALMAVFFALAGWLAWRLRPRSDVVWLVTVVPGVWTLVEWLRGWFLTGFPWLSAGYSQIDSPLAGFGPVLGVFGISLAVALSAGLLALWRRPGAVVALLALWGVGHGLSLVSWSQAAAEPFQVSLLQASVPQSDKWRAQVRQPTIDWYLRATLEAPDSQLVIWPETAVPAFRAEVEQTLLEPLHELLRAEGRDVVLGIVDGDPDGAYYNAMLSLGVSGRDHYHKRHLVPFGEYLPLDRWTRPVLDFLQIPMSDFTLGGDREPVLSLVGQPVGMNICYEDAYADEVIRALPRATLLINASNDAWFGDSLAPHQHLEIARMRSLETARFLLRATNTGISAVIDERGKITSRSPQFVPAVLTETVRPLQGVTPFVRWGHGGVVALAILLVAVPLVVGRR